MATGSPNRPLVYSDNGAPIGPESSQGLDLLSKEVEFRQTHIWKTGKQFVLLVVALQVVPYANPNISRVLGDVAIVFPVFAFLLAIAATWLLYGEYLRLLQVLQKYRRFMGPYAADIIEKKTRWEAVAWAPIGPTAALVFVVGSLITTVINVIILMNM